MRAFVSGKVLEVRPLSRRGGEIVRQRDGQPLFLTKLFDGVGEVFEVVGAEPGGAANEEVVLRVQVNLREYNGQKQLSLWLDGRSAGPLPDVLPTAFSSAPADDSRPAGSVSVRANGRTYAAAESNGADAPALAGGR
jgi:hypothetical protein